VLFSKGKHNRLSVPEWESFLHPVHAKIFSFFTFNRPLQATLYKLSEYLKRDEMTVRKIIFPFIENPLSVYTKHKEDKVKIPKNVIVNRNQIAGEITYLNLNPDVFSCQTIDITTQRAYTGPQLITFMLNNSCIANCLYCYADKKTTVNNSLSTARILELIEEANSLPVHLINLMGGEIFLHPDWKIILKKLVDLNLSPEYISTKIPLTEEIIQSIIATGFTNPVQISLDACFSGLLMKTLSVGKDYLFKVLQGIIELDNSGLKYRITSVLTTYNAKSDVIEELFRFIAILKNISDWRITPAVNSNWIDYEKFRKIKSNKKEIESLYEFVESEIIPHSTIPILLNRPAIEREFHYCKTGSMDFKGLKCSALNNQLFILPDGKATICEQLYWLPQFLIGDLSIDTITEVWNSTKAKKILYLRRDDIQDESPCKACKLFEPCFKAGNRCWVDIVKAYGNENWDYPDPRCAFAPEMTYDLGF
jgi:radical SAM protein with 4Fe4S-binding SPASM domain